MPHSQGFAGCPPVSLGDDAERPGASEPTRPSADLVLAAPFSRGRLSFAMCGSDRAIGEGR